VQETEDVEKEKVLSKKARKALAKAEHEREHALAAAFYREFWPENVWFMIFSRIDCVQYESTVFSTNLFKWLIHYQGG
jgi:hypothetical protein